MVNDEKIRKYLEGELSGEELKNFENEISKSASLEKGIDNYRNTLNKLKSLKKIKADEDYFANILPHFNERVTVSRELIYKPSFASGVIILILAAAVLILILHNNSEISENDQTAFQNLSREELNEYLLDHSDELLSSKLADVVQEEYDSLLNLMILEELNLNNYSPDMFVDVSGSEFNNIIDQLSKEEINEIYSILIKEDFN